MKRTAFFAGAVAAALAGCASAPKSDVDEVARARAAIAQEDALTQMAFWANEYQRAPQDVTAARGFVDALQRGGRADRAAQVANEALARHPLDPVLLAALGEAALATNDMTTAIQAFNALVGVAPNDVYARTKLGIALDQSGRHRLAQQVYQDALELAPEDAGLLNNLGVSKLLAGDIEGAREALERAAAAPDAPPHARQNLALALGLAGRFAEAERLARMDVPPDVAANNMAFVRALRGDTRRWSDLTPQR